MHQNQSWLHNYVNGYVTYFRFILNFCFCMLWIKWVIRLLRINGFFFLLNIIGITKDLWQWKMEIYRRFLVIVGGMLVAIGRRVLRKGLMHSKIFKDFRIKILSISACGVWGAKAGIQVSRREFYTHIHLDYVRVEILSCKKKKILRLISVY